VDRPEPSGVVTLTTDFGTADHYAGVLHGVILSGFGGATIVDLTHGVQPQQIEQGAFLLGQGYAAFPTGSVHVAVVDPGVGTGRRCLVATAHGHYFVGPDNGVLSHVLAAAPAEVIAVNVERVLPPPSSWTFHGRDIFAPLGARVAGGEDFRGWGDVIDDWGRLRSPDPEPIGPGRWSGRVLNVDRFGNLVTNLKPELITAVRGSFAIHVGAVSVTRQAGTYSDVEGDGPFVIAGSAGLLEISVRCGSAADEIEVGLGAPVELTVNSLS
jgi:S-adenosylmethionine hydrolase